MYFNRWAKRDLTSAYVQLATLCNIAWVLEVMHFYWIRHKDFSQLDLKHNEIFWQGVWYGLRPLSQVVRAWPSDLSSLFLSSPLDYRSKLFRS